jgi:hypothetical protein
MLAPGGYLADLKIFYCPTGQAFDWSLQRPGWSSNWAAMINTDVGNLKKMGGFESRYLTYGALDWVSTNGWGLDGQGRTFWRGNSAFGGTVAVGCSYAYRNQITAIGSCGAGYSIHIGAGTGQLLPIFSNHCFPRNLGQAGFPQYSNPPPFPQFVGIRNAGPERPTTKLLGDRSVIIDRFSKPRLQDSEGRLTCPGDGMYAHRDGYNVLYGDWSAGWYGDPQQKLIWTPSPQYWSNDAGGTWLQGGNNILSVSDAYGEMISDGIGFFHYFDRDGSVAGWGPQGWGN